MQLMDQMQAIDELERQLERTQYGGDIDDIDDDKLRELLGDEAAETLDQLKQFLEVLEEAGYIRKKGNNWELTPRGTRKIGQKALGEIYAQLKKDSPGKHEVRDARHRRRAHRRHEGLRVRRPVPPASAEHDHELDAARGRPAAGAAAARTTSRSTAAEQLTQTHTVMMVDLSWSMALRGSFQAAKKVAHGAEQPDQHRSSRATASTSSASPPTRAS